MRAESASGEAPQRSPGEWNETGDWADLARRYGEIRRAMEELAAPLSGEDQTVQSMPDASPTKWHRAHTTWFFETFLLVPHLDGYKPFDEAFGYLFNSYYEAVGPRHPRPARGMLTRPAISEIAQYRAHVDAAMAGLLAWTPASLRDLADLRDLIELGLHHEQQHQELLLTDIKHLLSLNPTRPVYRPADAPSPASLTPPRWIDMAGGVYRVGHNGEGFAFDNEGPAHDVLLRDYRIADRPVSVGDYLDFIADGGYRRPEFWLSDGWATVQSQGWEAPFYGHREEDGWSAFTLHGQRPLRLDEPACHISYYEAAAYAAWAGKRLPTEFEWEAAARLHPPSPRRYPALSHPLPLSPGFSQDVWEWTGSGYFPYPRYKPAPGAVGEYNGKFMVNLMVLRGRSCATPPGHERLSYRNFFLPASRWQFTGFRLAEDL